jgi:hypothetical protein
VEALLKSKVKQSLVRRQKRSFSFSQISFSPSFLCSTYTYVSFLIFYIHLLYSQNDIRNSTSTPLHLLNPSQAPQSRQNSSRAALSRSKECALVSQALLTDPLLPVMLCAASSSMLDDYLLLSLRALHHLFVFGINYDIVLFLRKSNRRKEGRKYDMLVNVRRRRAVVDK